MTALREPLILAAVAGAAGGAVAGEVQLDAHDLRALRAVDTVRPASADGTRVRLLAHLGAVEWSKERGWYVPTDAGRAALATGSVALTPAERGEAQRRVDSASGKGA